MRIAFSGSNHVRVFFFRGRDEQRASGFWGQWRVVDQYLDTPMYLIATPVSHPLPARSRFLEGVTRTAAEIDKMQLSLSYAGTNRRMK